MAKTRGTWSVSRVHRHSESLSDGADTVRSKDERNMRSLRPFAGDPDGLDRHFYREIGQRELLTRQEEAILGQRSRNNDLEARNELVVANMRLVVSMAQRLVGYGVSLSDLVQEGVIGLIRAAERYDPSVGCRFGTYAYFWIRQSLLKGLARSKRMIRLPFLMDSVLSRVRRTTTTGFDERQALVDLTERQNLNRDCVSSAYAADRGEIPFEGAPERGGRLKSPDAGLDPEEVAVEKVAREELLSVLNTLPDRDAYVLKTRFGVGTDQPLTLEQVGSRLGITKEAVRQIQNRALSMLRQPRRLDRLAVGV